MYPKLPGEGDPRIVGFPAPASPNVMGATALGGDSSSGGVSGDAGDRLISAYDQQVAVIANVLKPVLRGEKFDGEGKLTGEGVLADAVKLIPGYRGGEDVDLWEGFGHRTPQGQSRMAYRQKTAADAARVITEFSPRKEEAERMPLSVAVAQSIRQDRDGTGSTRADHMYFAVETAFAETILTTPQQVEDAERATFLSMLNGFYKLHQWGVGDPLVAAVETMRTLTANNQGFDPANAGFAALYDRCRLSLAVLRADRVSKPNYAYAKSERAHQEQALYQTLDTLAEVMAYVGARDPNNIARGMYALHPKIFGELAPADAE